MKNTADTVRHALLTALTSMVLMVAPASSPGFEPADPDLIPEAREVLDYLTTIYGQKTLIGQDKFWEAERFHEATGKYPAIISSDLSGWSRTRWDDQYQRTLQHAIDQSKDWWHKQGPHWLYCLPWYVGKDPKWNPPDWVKKVHDHEVFVTLDRLPKWTKREGGSH